MSDRQVATWIIYLYLFDRVSSGGTMCANARCVKSQYTRSGWTPPTPAHSLLDNGCARYPQVSQAGIPDKVGRSAAGASLTLHVASSRTSPSRVGAVARQPLKRDINGL